LKKRFGLTDILSVQSATVLLIQFENTFKSKDNLAIHPRDLRSARITGFSRYISIKAQLKQPNTDPNLIRAQPLKPLMD
jgi:hypothetical protein